MVEAKITHDPYLDESDITTEDGYDAWFREGVEKARREARERPEDLLPLAEALRRLKL